VGLPAQPAGYQGTTSRGQQQRGGSRAEHCDACFSGEYPLSGTEEANGKFALESSLPLVRA